MSSSKTVLLLSGGLDSTTLLYVLESEGAEVEALIINYGQRHGPREREAALLTCAETKTPYTVLDLTVIAKAVMGGSALTSPEVAVPDGHYADPSMKITVVPNRNMVLLSLAGAYAVSHGARRIAYAAHAGDHAIYPDCRPAFVAEMRRALELCDYEPIALHTPFLYWEKGAIVEEGAKLAVPFQNTYSCYKGGRLHCGTCGTCVERREAFKLAGVDDPTEYES